MLEATLFASPQFVEVLGHFGEAADSRLGQSGCSTKAAASGKKGSGIDNASLRGRPGERSKNSLDVVASGTLTHGFNIGFGDRLSSHTSGCRLRGQIAMSPMSRRFHQLNGGECIVGLCLAKKCGQTGFSHLTPSSSRNNTP